MESCPPSQSQRAFTNRVMGEETALLVLHSRLTILPRPTQSPSCRNKSPRIRRPQMPFKASHTARAATTFVSNTASCSADILSFFF